MLKVQVQSKIDFLYLMVTGAMTMMVMMMMMKAYKIMMVDTTGFRAADPGHADNTKKAGWENVLEPLCFFLGPFWVIIMRMNNGMMV